MSSSSTTDEYVQNLADEIVAKVLAGLAVHDDRPLLTVDQVARRLAMSRRAVYDMMDGGELAFLLVGGRRKVEPVEIDRFLARLRVDPAEGAA